MPGLQFRSARVAGKQLNDALDNLKIIAQKFRARQRFEQCVHPFTRNEMGAESCINGVRGVEPGARQAQIKPDAARAFVEKRGCADVGQQPDTGFRHGGHDVFAHNAVAAVDGNPDTAAHDDPVYQADIRLGKFGDGKVHGIFDVEELARSDRVLLAGSADLNDVSAGTKGALAFGGHDNGVNRIVGRPFVKVPVHTEAHGLGQRIEGLFLCKVHPADRAIDRKFYFR